MLYSNMIIDINTNDLYFKYIFYVYSDFFQSVAIFHWNQFIGHPKTYIKL